MARINDRIELEVAGETYAVVCDFMTIDQIEQRIGVMQLVQRLQDGDIRPSDLAWVIHSALTAAGHPVTYREAGQHVIEGGIQEAVNQVTSIINAALGAGPEEEPPKGKAGKRRTRAGRSSTA